MQRREENRDGFGFELFQKPVYNFDSWFDQVSEMPQEAFGYIPNSHKRSLELEKMRLRFRTSLQIEEILDQYERNHKELLK